MACGLFADSTLALGLLKADHLIYHRYTSIISRVKRLLRQKWEAVCHHLLHERNAATDFMAKLGADSSSPLLVWDEPPVAIASVLLTDRLGTVFLWE